MQNTIVLVDDNKELNDLCAEILEIHGFKVMSFTNVDAAKKYLLHTNVSNIYAIVSDLMMGPTDGLDFLSFVKSVPALAQIDFFLMTGAIVTVFEPFYRDFAIKGIIKKPFNVKDFLALLKENHNNTITMKIAA